MKKVCIALVLVATGCAVDSADPGSADPTGAGLPLNVDDYVITPAGYYHKDCVIDVGDDATIDDTTITHSDGSVEAMPTCDHPNFASLDDLVAGIPHRADVEVDSAVPSYTGWVSDDFKWASSWYK